MVTFGRGQQYRVRVPATAGLTQPNSRVILLNISGGDGSTSTDSRVILLNVSGSDRGGLDSVELSAPATVDPFELVQIIATVTGGTGSEWTWQQLAGRTVEPTRADDVLQFEAPADIDAQVLQFRVTVDGSVTAEISIGVWPADDFTSTTDAEWIPTTSYELVDV